jgi:aldose 1-epimerase
LGDRHREVTKSQHLMAKVYDPVSGRGFELWSNQPGLQFYSGNFLDGTSYGKSKPGLPRGRCHRDGAADLPGCAQPARLPGSARLAPGQTYRNVMIYRLTTGQRREALGGT